MFITTAAMLLMYTYRMQNMRAFVSSLCYTRRHNTQWQYTKPCVCIILRGQSPINNFYKQFSLSRMNIWIKHMKWMLRVKLDTCALETIVWMEKRENVRDDFVFIYKFCSYSHDKYNIKRRTNGAEHIIDRHKIVFWLLFSSVCSLYSRWLGGLTYANIGRRVRTYFMINC